MHGITSSYRRCNAVDNTHVRMNIGKENSVIENQNASRREDYTGGKKKMLT